MTSDVYYPRSLNEIIAYVSSGETPFVWGIEEFIEGKEIDRIEVLDTVFQTAEKAIAKAKNGKWGSYQVEIRNLAWLIKEDGLLYLVDKANTLTEWLDSLDKIHKMVFDLQIEYEKEEELWNTNH